MPAAEPSWVIGFAQLGEIPAALRPLPGSTFSPPHPFWYAAARAEHPRWLRRVG
ncbi:hypothetical protein [Nonomuraea jiangxiensis]|uniref:hypothetical protein n=1 Tax=Nonomuraea jiangxiensis TaxID=633440 RepID=UPI0015A3DA6C|nr:hypothetical protein [Nonomuraea jiangxiensis]